MPLKIPRNFNKEENNKVEVDHVEEALEALEEEAAVAVEEAEEAPDLPDFLDINLEGEPKCMLGRVLEVLKEEDLRNLTIDYNKIDV